MENNTRPLNSLLATRQRTLDVLLSDAKNGLLATHKHFKQAIASELKKLQQHCNHQSQEAANLHKQNLKLSQELTTQLTQYHSQSQQILEKMIETQIYQNRYINKCLLTALITGTIGLIMGLIMGLMI